MIYLPLFILATYVFSCFYVRLNITVFIYVYGIIPRFFGVSREVNKGRQTSTKAPPPPMQAGGGVCLRRAEKQESRDCAYCAVNRQQTLMQAIVRKDRQGISSI